MNILSTDAVRDRVMFALAESKPFALTRYGHCESRFLEYDPGAPRDDVNRSLRGQLGRNDFTDEQCGNIAQSVRHAFRESDIAGAVVPSDFATIRPQLDALLHKIKVTANERDLWTPGQEYCTPRIHLDLLRSEALRTIIAAAENILLISCRDLASSFQVMYGKTVEQIFVPQEHRTVGIGAQTCDIPHFPDAFELVLEEISTATRVGQLVLVGAGFLGKAYCISAKRAGAIVVDIGSVFDVFAGIHSRTSFDKPEYTRHRMASLAVDDRPAPGVIRKV